jgi:hypothetical protein
VNISKLFSGTTANDIHFQVFLLDGIDRWNTERASAALDASVSKLRSFDAKLQDKVNSLTVSVLGAPMNANYKPPAAYTGELFGVEYLYTETGNVALITGNIEDEIEEGIIDEPTDDERNSSSQPILDLDPETSFACEAFHLPAEIEDRDSSSSDPDDDQTKSTDFKAIEGWDKVDQLAAVLIDAKGLSLTNAEAEHIIRLYEDLSDYDKRPLVYSRSLKSPKGRFARSKNQSGHVGQEAMKRCFVSAGSPSLPPSKSRVVEAICIRLFNVITGPKREPYVSRFTQVIQRYNEIRSRIAQSHLIGEKTGLVLYQINETTVTSW